MKELFICFILASTLALAYGLATAQDSLVTGSLVFLGCMIGSLVGTLIKEQRRKRSALSKTYTAWVKAIIKTCIFVEAIVILSHYSPWPQYHWVDLSGRVILVLCCSMGIMVGSLWMLHHLMKREAT